MISVILTASGDTALLGRMLAALVPAAVEGLVREVAVIGAVGPVAALADDAGATLYPAGAFAEAAAKARSAWLCAIPLGVEFAPDWVDRVSVHVAQAPPRPARLTIRRLIVRGAEGWLISKRLAASGAGEQDLQRLARRDGLSLAVLRRG